MSLTGNHTAGTGDHVGDHNALDLALQSKVDTSDTRLTNARTPTAHAATHASGGSDPLTAVVRTVNGTAPNAAGNVVVSASGTVADATSSVNGVVRLNGDLGGTAAAPTVPGLTTVVQRANHTGTQSADTLTNGTTNKVYTATEQARVASLPSDLAGKQSAFIPYATIGDAQTAASAGQIPAGSYLAIG